MSSGEASGIGQCNLGIFDSVRLLSIKNGRGFPRTLCSVTCFWFDLDMRQLLLQERVMSVTNLTQVSSFRRERDIRSQVKNVSFLKMTPYKHWRIA